MDGKPTSGKAFNPYEPPQSLSPGVWLAREDGGDIQASLLSRGWVYRRILIIGPITAEVEYNGRGLGFETVRVDGEIVARQSSPWTLAPCLRFTISAGSRLVPARIDVRGVLTLGAFRLWIDETMVDSEGMW